jgi:hypothetical protein
MGVSSLTTRRAVAAVATVLVLLVPSIAVRAAVESAGAPDELALLTPAVATEYAWRVFDDVRAPFEVDRPIERLSTELVVVGLVGWIALGAAVCWVSYAPGGTTMPGGRAPLPVRRVGGSACRRIGSLRRRVRNHLLGPNGAGKSDAAHAVGLAPVGTVRSSGTIRARTSASHARSASCPSRRPCSSR